MNCIQCASSLSKLSACLKFPCQTSASETGSEQQQNDTSVDAAVKSRRRREAEGKPAKKTNSKVKREAEPAKDTPQTELVRLGSKYSFSSPISHVSLWLIKGI